MKATGQAINNALTTFGWVQSADTGQVNWSTYSSLANVYEVWKPGDALAVFYVRIDYIYNSNSAPSFKVTLGTTTNGSGTITGVNTGALTVTSALNSVSSSTPYSCYFSGSASRFSMLLWTSTTTSSFLSMFLAIERSLDANGNYTATHASVIWAGWNTSNQRHQRTLHFSSGITNEDSGICAIQSGTATTASGFAGNVPISPLFPNIGYFDYPLTVAATGRATDFSEGSTYATTLYGASRTYIASKKDALGNFMPSDQANGVVLMRYD
jgi:hypothetical protein